MVAGLPGPAIFLGPELELSDQEAVRLITAGKAVPSKPAIERAVKNPRETR
jgi:hypothetical protein